MNRKEFFQTPLSAITTKYESYSEDLKWKLDEIESAAINCVKLAETYTISRKLFALLQDQSPSRQLTEGFERVRKILYAKQEEIMDALKGGEQSKLR